MKKNKFCQSCGMPLHKDPAGGATEADGSRSQTYCSLCMDKGVFYYDGTDVQAFQKIVINKMVEHGWWRPLAWLMTRQIPKLDRWASPK